MERFASRLGVSFLTFAIGLAVVSLVIFRAQAGQTVNVEPVVDPVTAPAVKSQKTLEMVFVLDTTGSMGGLIEGAKTKIWGIVNEVMQRQDHPNVKVGLVAYRDNGDAYVTQVTPLTDDLDAVYTKLMDFRADGGGDTPENVRRGLADGVEKAGWSKANQNTAQILFLVGDAPPHNDYGQEPDVLVTTAKAVRQNMIINTIQCGAADDTRQVWQQIAQRGEGKYFAIAQNGGVQAITTPYDARLSELASKIGSTYLAYGGGDGDTGVAYREEKQKTQAAAESKVTAAAPVAAQADRALNKAINERAYSDDLVQDVENNRVKLDEVKDADLPESMKKMTPAQRKAEIDRRLAERKQIREEILTLSKQRDAYIKAERAKSGKSDGFDAAVANALSEQMGRKGIK